MALEQRSINRFEPLYEKTCFMPYANNKDANQPEHPRSLISVFVARCLDSAMPVAVTYKIPRLWLASASEQTGFSLTWSKPLKSGFLVTEA